MRGARLWAALLTVALLAARVGAPRPPHAQVPSKRGRKRGGRGRGGGRGGRGGGRGGSAPGQRLAHAKGRGAKGGARQRRNVYIDLDASFATTLRLHHDLLPLVRSAVPYHERSEHAWEIYAWEGSPLAQPYLDAYVAWVDATSSAALTDNTHLGRASFPVVSRPELTVPPLKTPAHAIAYARLFGCRTTHEGAATTSHYELGRAGRNATNHTIASSAQCLLGRFAPAIRQMGAFDDLRKDHNIAERLHVAAEPNGALLPRWPPSSPENSTSALGN